MGQMLSVEDAAKVMDVHPRTVLRMINRGELDASKVGRVWRVAPGAINALAGAPVVRNGGNVTNFKADDGPARRLAVVMLAEALPIIQAYCRQEDKQIEDLSIEDVQRMV